MQDRQTGHMIAVDDLDEYDRLMAAGATVFEVGETLVLRGGRFVVESIDSEGVRLVGVPFSTPVGRASARRRARR